MKRSKYRNVEPSESQSQSAVIDWWRLACKGYGLPEFALFSIPNGAHKSMAARMKFKREGLRAGVPDLFLAVPHVLNCDDGSTAYIPGLWLEMKRKGGRVSPEQTAFLLYARKQGYHAHICYSADETIAAIKGYLA